MTTLARAWRAAIIPAAAVAAALFAADLPAQVLCPEVVRAFEFRGIGPSRQSGRFVDVAVPQQEPSTIYMATGSGGLWKSANNGISWTSIFDSPTAFAIGDLAVAPSNANVIYLGTGEHTSSRSTYAGDGVYKSTDAGKSWVNVGLKDTHHIGRIVVHPRNPDIVYVAALGHLYSENDERGVFKSVDGGRTWTKSLDVRDGGKAIGASDLVIDPRNPDVLYAAAYDKERKVWTFNLAGPASGVYKTTNAGKTWTKLGGGLPGGMLGRIGLDIYPKNPNILYANIENGNKPGMSDADRLKELREGKASAGMIGEEVYRTDDGGRTWRKVSPDKQKIGGGPGYYYMQVRVDPNDANHVYVLTVGMQESKDGGKTWAVPFRFGGDNHAMWIDPDNSRHMILGYDHGMGITWDGGQNWYHPDELPLSQFYAVGVDNMVPYNVYGGLQDNGSHRGPSTRRGGGPIRFEDWQVVGGGDGFYNVVDPVTNRYLYNESQFGEIARTDLYTGEVKRIKHQDPALRFNWNAPILVSPHDSSVVYHGANKLLKSVSRGDVWTEISPDLTTNDKARLPTGKGGDGNIQFCTITTVDESPIVRDLLYVGTDDGNVWVSRDGGANWAKLNDNIAGHPAGYWVSRVIASRHHPGTAYVTYTGYRADDPKAYIYRTTDFGKTWAPLKGDLPEKAINVVREDPRNPNLLYAGTDYGVYASIDAGKTWTELKEKMPTQPVHDLVIHPRENDLVVGTHGRGIFIADVSALQELTADVLNADVHLFEVEPKVKWVTRRAHETAFTNIDAPSEPDGIVINYLLKAPVQGDVTVQVLQAGRVVAEGKGPNAAGINRVAWNMRTTPVTIEGGKIPPVERPAGWRRQREEPPIPTFGGTVAMDPGEYTVVLKAGGKTLTRTTQILEDVWFDKVF
jgi:photosystem II stability/assembly factor-like uncharacterized protein